MNHSCRLPEAFHGSGRTPTPQGGADDIVGLQDEFGDAWEGVDNWKAVAEVVHETVKAARQLGIAFGSSD